MNWLRQWIEWLQDLRSPREFIESLRPTWSWTRFIFTPKGEVKPLPVDATLDFAYVIHTDIGNTCIGAGQ